MGNSNSQHLAQPDIENNVVVLPQQQTQKRSSTTLHNDVMISYSHDDIDAMRKMKGIYIFIFYFTVCSFLPLGRKAEVVLL